MGWSNGCETTLHRRFISLSFFRFKTARTHSTYRERQKACCIASLLFSPFSLPLPFAFSRHTRVRSLSSSFVNDVTAFFLPRFQRVSTTMHVKSTRASIVTSRHQVFFLLSLSLSLSFYNIIKAAQTVCVNILQALLSASSPLPEILFISFRSTFYERGSSYYS